MIEDLPEQQRNRVEFLAQIGATPEDIAIDLQISRKQLRQKFRRELKRGAVQGRHIVLEKLFANASSGSNLAATAFWVKSRCGWRDTGPVPKSASSNRYVMQVITTAANDKTSIHKPVEHIRSNNNQTNLKRL